MYMVEHDASVKVRLAAPPKKCRNVYAMNHLINAALIDKGFCELLLKDPSNALSQGYYGEHFDLEPTDKQFVLSVGASSLPEFAERWIMLSDA
ncbi:hypothetical protein ACFLZW_03755 [Chloroflexota bacterium]